MLKNKYSDKNKRRLHRQGCAPEGAIQRGRQNAIVVMREAYTGHGFTNAIRSKAAHPTSLQLMLDIQNNNNNNNNYNNNKYNVNIIHTPPTSHTHTECRSCAHSHQPIR